MNLIHYVNQCWLFQVSWMEIMITERVKRRWRSKVATNSVQWLILKPRTSYVPPYSRKKSAVLARNANSPMISKNSWKANQKTLDHTVSCLRPTGNVRLDWPVDMAASTYRRTSKILSIKNFMKKNLRWAAKRCLVIPPFFFGNKGVPSSVCLIGTWEWFDWKSSDFEHGLKEYWVVDTYSFWGPFVFKQSKLISSIHCYSNHLLCPNNFSSLSNSQQMTSTWFDSIKLICNDSCKNVAISDYL